MAYTPELSQKQSATLRRIAWALGRPMTKTMGLIMDDVVERVEKQRVCAQCRDSSFCKRCLFHE